MRGPGGGAVPGVRGLTIDSAGNFYGATRFGGARGKGVRIEFLVSEHQIGGTRVWVLPNPSGLQARYQLPELTEVCMRRRMGHCQGLVEGSKAATGQRLIRCGW